MVRVFFDLKPDSTRSRYALFIVLILSSSMRVLEDSNVLDLRNPSTYLKVIIHLHASLPSKQPLELIPPSKLFADFALGDYLSRATTRYAFSPTCESVTPGTTSDE